METRLTRLADAVACDDFSERLKTTRSTLLWTSAIFDLQWRIGLKSVSSYP